MSTAAVCCDKMAAMVNDASYARFRVYGWMFVLFGFSGGQFSPAKLIRMEVITRPERVNGLSNRGALLARSGLPRNLSRAYAAYERLRREGQLRIRAPASSMPIGVAVAGMQQAIAIQASTKLASLVDSRSNITVSICVWPYAYGRHGPPDK